MTLRGNCRYYEKNSERFIRQYPGQFVVIAKGKEQGFYPTMDTAYCAAINEKKLKEGTFVVRECVNEQPHSPLYYFSAKK